ncbi:MULTISPECIES: ABC transporter permease [Lysinibacillus]|uniref:ABC transporter permease n=1 Tax=Lysinibacillus TaxID=400634 RepID=UPI00257C85A6|nr:MULTISPECIES: ABC transporter permease [Lysinibacillus]
MNVIKNVNNNRNIIFSLAKQNFKNRYLGSQLGILWAFIQPTIMIGIYWFVFEVGFKSLPVNDYPFLLWFIAGIIPWFYFSEAVSSATTSIIENTHLVKKIVFPVFVLPVISICSSLFVHLFFIIVALCLFLGLGYGADLYYLQIIYYLTFMLIMVSALAYITSALMIFLKDTGQIVAMMLQFGFWLTPIIWTIEMLPQKYEIFIKLNPMFYIVDGYRDSFINKVWFWEKPYLTFYNFIILILLIVIGVWVFKRLKPHFADLL